MKRTKHRVETQFKKRLKVENSTKLPEDISDTRSDTASSHLTKLHVDTINYSNRLVNDNYAIELNGYFSQYDLHVGTFDLSHCGLSAVGLDNLVKGPTGIKYLSSGGTDLSLIMQGLFSLHNVKIEHLNLSFNNIQNIGSDILGHALANGYLSPIKYINVSYNSITDPGASSFASALKTNIPRHLQSLNFIGNRLTELGKATIKTVVDSHNTDVNNWDKLITFTVSPYLEDITPLVDIVGEYYVCGAVIDLQI